MLLQGEEASNTCKATFASLPTNKNYTKFINSLFLSLRRIEMFEILSLSKSYLTLYLQCMAKNYKIKKYIIISVF